MSLSCVAYEKRMKINFKFKKKIQSFSPFLVCLLVLFFQNNSQTLNALTMDKNQNEFITEELRLEIPTKFKEVWLKAENEVWEPWLSIQDGYLGRQIFWDNEKEEALILVKWKNKRLWKSLSIEEVNEIQKKFEENIKTSLNMSVNPLKLIYEGELIEQG